VEGFASGFRAELVKRVKVARPSTNFWVVGSRIGIAVAPEALMRARAAAAAVERSRDGAALDRCFFIS